jgi:hypothetical protein
MNTDESSGKNHTLPSVLSDDKIQALETKDTLVVMEQTIGKQEKALEEDIEPAFIDPNAGFFEPPMMITPGKKGCLT